MDLGYSSSESDTEDENITVKKRDFDDYNDDKPEKNDVDISNIFKLNDINDNNNSNNNNTSKRIKSDLQDTRINNAIFKVLNDKLDLKEEKEEEEEEENEINSITSPNEENNNSVKKSFIPVDANIKELNIDEFYKKNQNDIESGILDANRQDKIGNITFHNSGGSSNIGRLDKVIRFNIINEDKISFQNKERIAKEHAIARDKINQGRG
ncbi:hypothetical protein C6P40_003379 [Pichia californica]|uniref:Uncharacterized protein n=1 Tax=Pichia californica TaxID=460514 RepID=A0A9P6WNK0_9ASCO|nr:hypothetical protein C6P42_004443 [[Candida] californica]KAG0690265.1 hypothetical protein C6P40_003379 [[Candida] californica]